MSTAPLVYRARLLASPSVRQFLASLLFTAVMCAIGVVLYVTETYVLRLEHRFVENPVVVMMRSCGIAHFLLAWLFLFTSPRLWQRAALVRLGICAILGGLLCVGCASWGASSNPFVFMLVYAVFLIHDVRDRAELYFANGEAPRTPAMEATVYALQQAASAVLITVMVLGYLAQELLLPGRAHLSTAPWPIHAALTLCLLTVSGWLVFRALRCAGGTVALWHVCAPLLLVYTVMLGVLLLGASTFYLVILIHAGTWFVFLQQQYAKEPVRAQSLWRWLRATPTGFATLHLVMIGLVLVLLALRVHLWQRVGLVSELMASHNFLYWSLMHIATSFWRRH